MMFYNHFRNLTRYKLFRKVFNLKCLFKFTCITMHFAKCGQINWLSNFLLNLKSTMPLSLTFCLYTFFYNFIFLTVLSRPQKLAISSYFSSSTESNSSISKNNSFPESLISKTPSFPDSAYSEYHNYMVKYKRKLFVYNNCLLKFLFIFFTYYFTILWIVSSFWYDIIKNVCTIVSYFKFSDFRFHNILLLWIL